VRKLALRPANVGRRIHNGYDVGPAAWPAIIEGEQHQRIVVLLTDPARRQIGRDAFVQQGAASRRYLLSFGIASCGVCGGVLRASTKRIKRKVARRRKPENPEGIVVDDRPMYLVESVIVQRLSRPDATDLLLPAADASNTGARVEARALRQRLDDAAEDYAAGLIDREQMRRVAANLRPRLETAEVAAQSARGPLPRELRDLAGAGTWPPSGTACRSLRSAASCASSARS